MLKVILQIHWATMSRIVVVISGDITCKKYDRRSQEGIFQHDEDVALMLRNMELSAVEVPLVNILSRR